VGRHNHDGDPLTPSRLLFACGADSVIRRARQFFPSAEDVRTVVAEGGGETTSDSRRLEVPPPAPLAEPITRLRVTAFRDYLACPYRFYLRHVAKLSSVSDSLDELDGAGFGSLAHEVLRRFGIGASRHSTNAAEILAALDQELDRCSMEMFGRNPLPAVRVQVEQLRWRLRAFAEHQADWSQQGWRIQHVEASPPVKPGADPGSRFDVDGKPFWLTGRMDRIDVHSDTGERVILDYKTSDTGQSPRETHQSGGAWIDLQLPLYRHLAAPLGVGDPVGLGYILLPKESEASGFALANWTNDELAAADECARQVVRGIRQQRFFPPADESSPFLAEFDPICHAGVALGERTATGDKAGRIADCR
jgi:hypothetical protein